MENRFLFRGKRIDTWQSGTVGGVTMTENEAIEIAKGGGVNEMGE